MPEVYEFTARQALVAGSLAHWFGPEYLENYPGITANMLSLIDYTVKTLRDAKS